MFPEDKPFQLGYITRRESDRADIEPDEPENEGESLSLSADDSGPLAPMNIRLCTYGPLDDDPKAFVEYVHIGDYSIDRDGTVVSETLFGKLGEHFKEPYPVVNKFCYPSSISMHAQ